MRSFAGSMLNCMVYFKRMKTIIIIALALAPGLLNAQSLKDALYGGKLKADTGTLIKKGDSLRFRTDTVVAKSPTIETVQKPDSVLSMGGVDTKVSIPAGETPTVAPPVVNPTIDNNKIWKSFVEEYTQVIKAEVMPSKKIKPGTYSVLIEYEIGLDGYVTTNSISVSPQSSHLADQVKQRMMFNAPQLSPLLTSNGKPRISLKKQMLTFVKEKD